MNINILRFSLFGIAGDQEVDHTFVKFIIYPLAMIAFSTTQLLPCLSESFVLFYHNAIMQ